MTGRIRVLWLIKGLGPGGAEALLAASAPVRDRDRFEYAAAYLVPQKATLVSALEHAGMQVTCLRASSDADVAWARRLRRLLEEEPVGIVHAHSPFVAAVARLVIRTLPRRVRPISVSTEHNIWPAYTWPTRAVNALTYALDRLHFAVSEEVRRSMPAWWRRQTETVLHGVAVESVRGHRAQRGRLRAELGIAPDELAVVTVANYRVHKDYYTLLAAARSVLDRGLPVRFFAVGQGPLEQEIHEAHAQLQLGDSFRLLGYRADALDVMAGGDVFVLGSRREGLPVALMEALALGLPVVATEAGGIAEAITDGVEGLLVPAGQPDALAEAIVRVVSDPVLRTRLAEGSLKRSAEFDIRRAVRLYECRYEELAREDTGAV